MAMGAREALDLMDPCRIRTLVDHVLGFSACFRGAPHARQGMNQERAAFWSVRAITETRLAFPGPLDAKLRVQLREHAQISHERGFFRGQLRYGVRCG